VTADVEEWPPTWVDVERYCAASGRPVHHEGDRCRSHGAADRPCTTDVRPAGCEYPRLSPNHPYPCCEECGKRLDTEAAW